MATLLKTANFSGKNGTQFELNLYYEVLSQDIANNKSKIRYYLYWKSPGGYSGSGSTVTGYINNSSVGTATSISAGENKLMGTKDVTITHNTDGTFPNTSYSAKIDTSWTLGDASVSGTLTSSNVDTIPRKSTITFSGGNIDEKSTITIKRASSSFTHTLRYDFGSLTNKTIVSKTTSTSYSWTIPTTFYAQIPNAKSGKGTLYCDTYSGSTLVGTSSISFTAKTVESKCKPDVSATVADSNELTIGLTGNSNKLVKSVSNAKVTTTATAKNSASISSIKVTCGDGKSGTGSSVTLNKVTSGDFTITATDSRGYSTSTTISKTLVNYVPLTLNYNFYRPEPTTGEVVMNVSGKYFNDSFGKVSNHLTVQYRYKESGGTYPEEYRTVTVNVTTSNTYSLELSLGTDFDYQKSYDFQILAYDKITEGSPITKTQHVTEGIPMLGLFKDSIEAFGNTLVESSDNGNVIHIADNNYLSEGGYGLNMHNSDIVQTNAIYMNDESTTYEGIGFLKQDGDNTNPADFEFLRGYRGSLYYDDKVVSVVDSYSFAANGYIRYTNGFQIAWVYQSVTAGGTAFGNVYYSDHEMPDWAMPFTTVYFFGANVNALMYWATLNGSSATNAGTVRCYRPTSTTSTTGVRAFAIGKWK